jgi:hypothetical protein
VQIDDGQIVVGIGPRGGHEGLPAVGLVELCVRVEPAQQALHALADEFMVVGHKKLHGVSACRLCRLIAALPVRCARCAASFASRLSIALDIRSPHPLHSSRLAAGPSSAGRRAAPRAAASAGSPSMAAANVAANAAMSCRALPASSRACLSRDA